jgi:phage terminase large subunit-like protein
LRQLASALPVKLVHARRGKYRRAVPTAGPYEQNRLHHVGRHVALDD